MKYEKEGQGAKQAGFVRRMEAEGKLIFHKVTNPSKHLINKYGSKKNEPEPEIEHLFNTDEQVEYNVSKPKKKTSKTKQPLEVDLERKEEQQRKEAEEKEKFLNSLLQLKEQTLKIKKEIQKEKSRYMDFLDQLKPGTWGQLKTELEKRRGKKITKEEIQNEAIQKHNKSILNIWQKYPDLNNFIDENKLDKTDINSVFSFINSKIKSA